MKTSIFIIAIALAIMLVQPAQAIFLPEDNPEFFNADGTPRAGVYIEDANKLAIIFHQAHWGGVEFDIETKIPLKITVFYSDDEQIASYTLQPGRYNNQRFNLAKTIVFEGDTDLYVISDSTHEISGSGSNVAEDYNPNWDGNKEGYECDYEDCDLYGEPAHMPEFGTTAAGLTLVLSGALFMFLRKRH